MFRTGVDVGVDVPAADLRRDFDAVLLAGGARPAARPRRARPRARRRPLRDGVPHRSRTARCEGDGDRRPAIIGAEDKHVVIIGGGDTGADCLGTAHRQGARSVHSARAAAAAAGRSRRRQPVAAVAERLPRLVGARREAASGSTRSRRRTSRRRPDGRVRAAARPSRGRGPCRGGRIGFEPVPGTRVRAAGRPGAAGDGFHRPGAAPPADRPRASG